MRLGLILAWGTVTACLATQVHAQAIDPAAATATIGAPLDLLVHLRPAQELGAARFDRRCVHVEAQIGDRLIDNQALQVDLGQAGDDGLTPVRLRHPRKVDEPIVQLHVRLLCGAFYSREFYVLAQEAAPDQPAGGDARKAIRRTITRTLPPPDARPPVASRTSAAATIERPVSLQATSPPDTSLASARTSTSELQALARSVMKLLQAAGLPGTTSNLPEVAQTTSPDAIAQNNYLLQELQRLRGEQQQASTAIASLHARLARAEDDRWLQAGWMMFAALAGLIAFGLLTRLGDALIPLLARRWRLSGSAPGPQDRSPRPVRQSIAGADDLHDALAVARPVHPQPSPRPFDLAVMPAILAARSPSGPYASSPTNTGSALETIDFDTESSSASTPTGALADTASSGARGAAELTDEQLARAHRWSKASFGPASLDHNIVRPLRHDIDNAIAMGYLGFAATMLEQTLYSGTGKHPWALMRLLDVYEALGQPDNHDRVCAEIEALYSVRPPTYRSTRSDTTEPPSTPSLLESLADWPALCAAWAHEDACALIETCLLRGKNRFELDLQTFADLLFLHELAQIRNNEPLTLAEPLDSPAPVATRPTPAMADALTDHSS